MKCKSWFSHLALALTLGAGFCCATQAQSFPSRVITIVVPFAPGGPTDLSVRLIGKALATRLKQPVIIENKPGAGSTVGAGMVAHATADGYTLLWASTSSLGVAPALYPKLTFSPLTSFAPIGMVARSPLILVGRGNTPVHSLTGFIAAAHTGKLAYGSAGSGSVTHLVGEWFKDEARIDLLHVPYKGGAMALNDLLAGQVDLTFETISTVQPFLKSGRVQILATTGRARAPQFPNVPTVAEILRDDFEA
jgi:tripartite-type tricarboxylate transporter receptor subunit TctC